MLAAALATVAFSHAARIASPITSIRTALPLMVLAGERVEERPTTIPETNGHLMKGIESSAPPRDAHEAPFATKSAADLASSTAPLDLSEASSTDDEQLWRWQLAMLAITACWGANFAVTKMAIDSLGDPSDGALFVAARFLLGAAALLPFAGSASSGSPTWCSED